MYPIDEKKIPAPNQIHQKSVFLASNQITPKKSADLRQITLFIVLNSYYLHTITYDLAFLVYKDNFQ